jgi:hypothetical protein
MSRENFAFFRVVLACLCVSLSACGGSGNTSAVSPAAPQQPQAPSQPKELRILVIGQSLSANCNANVYGPVANVYQIGKDGAVKAAQDPFEWADCDKGSMWMPLGQRLIESGMAQKVTFMPIGVGGTKVQDWQEGGKAFLKLNTALDLVAKSGIGFDMAFWHQGSADAGIPRDEYVSRLLSVIAYVNGKIPVKRWLIGIHSRCWERYDAEVEAAQRIVADAPGTGRFPGANTNLLGNEYRFDECHLNQAGQEQMAKMWLEAIRNASSGT